MQQKALQGTSYHRAVPARQGTMSCVLCHSQGCTVGSSEGKLLGKASLGSASCECKRIQAVHALASPAANLSSQALLKTTGKSWPLLLHSYQSRDGRTDAPVCMYYICAWADYTNKLIPFL